MKRKTLAIGLVVTLGLGSAAAAWLIGPDTQPVVEAADHNDPPGRVTGSSADRAADIADLFTFVRGENTVFVLTFAGPEMPAADQAGTYDADVVYQIWVDDNGFDAADGVDDPRFAMNVRFGQNASGNWGVQIENFPGTSAVVAGPVEHMNSVSSGGMFWAGLRDDPFFFDLDGFLATATTGELAFNAGNDTFEGQNVTAIVIEIPNSEIDSTFDTWATTARITTGS